VPLGLADVLVEQLRALDVEEVAGVLFLAATLGDLLGQRVGHRLGDHGLAAAGRAVEQDALRRAQLVLPEEVGVQERQLDRVADRLDLGMEAADVLVSDVGHLLQHELLDLALGDPLVRVRRAGLDHQRVACAERRADERLREVDDPLLVGVGHHQRPVARTTCGVLQHLLEHDHLADPLVAERVDDVERVVEQDLLPAPQLVDVE
jgi:hypothetical protein